MSLVCLGHWVRMALGLASWYDDPDRPDDALAFLFLDDATVPMHLCPAASVDGVLQTRAVCVEMKQIPFCNARLLLSKMFEASFGALVLVCKSRRLETADWRH